MRQSSSPGLLMCLLRVLRLQALTRVLPGPLLRIYVVSLRTRSRLAVDALDSSHCSTAATQTPCTLGIHLDPLCCPCGTGDLRNWHKYADMHSACCALSDKGLCLWPRVLCLLSASTKLWQANLLDKIKSQTWQFWQRGMECWKRHDFVEEEPLGQVWEYKTPWNLSGSECSHSRDS